MAELPSLRGRVVLVSALVSAAVGLLAALSAVLLVRHEQQLSADRRLLDLAQLFATELDEEDAPAVAQVALGALGCGPATPPATFTEVYAALFPLGTKGQCNYCHDRPANDLSNGKLDMGHDASTAYAALVGPRSVSAKCGGTGDALVVPGHPEASLFFLKFQATPPCGDRMPQGGSPLTDAQLEQVRSWIAAGAKDD